MIAKVPINNESRKEVPKMAKGCNKKTKETEKKKK
jgi:hypothetical protein